MAIKSTNRRYSRYTQGGSTETTETMLGFWDRKVLPKSDTDLVVTIDSKYQHSPWLLAFDTYGSVELMWLIYQYNNILDPLTEFISGKFIRLPSPSRLHIDILTSRPEV